MGSTDGLDARKKLIESATFNLTDVDRQTLLQTDDEFVPHSWKELKEIVAANDLSLFRRTPSQLARYIEWSIKIKAEYGTILNYVCQKRLHWEPQAKGNSEGNDASSTASRGAFAVKSTVPFADPTDYKILRNDWPYGMAPGIVHMVVWLKTPIATDPADGSLRPEGRVQIQQFVDRTFVERLEEEGGAADQVLWFKNWAALQSVGALEHFHVMVRNVDDRLLLEWTGENERAELP